MLDSDTKITKSLSVRRLFKQDVDIIMEKYSLYDSLYFNPVTPVFISQVLLWGEFWGVFDGEEMVGCSWLFEAEKEFFESFISSWECKDLLNTSWEDWLVCGYVYCNDDYKNLGMYDLMCRLWNMQGAKLGKKHLLHYSPVKTWCDLPALFKSGFVLKGMRGLDNLVLHYIFTKKITFTKIKYYDKEKAVTSSLKQSKELTKYLEHGFFAFDVDKDGTFYLVKETTL